MLAWKWVPSGLLSPNTRYFLSNRIPLLPLRVLHASNNKHQAVVILNILYKFWPIFLVTTAFLRVRKRYQMYQINQYLEIRIFTIAFDISIRKKVFTKLLISNFKKKQLLIKIRNSGMKMQKNTIKPTLFSQFEETLCGMRFDGQLM